MIRLMKPYLRYEDMEQDFREVFESGIFTRGRNVEAFSAEFAEYVGAKHAFFATSATTALWVCLRLLKISPGDEVAVSDFSFPATANVVEDVGAHPVFIDVDLATFNMRPDDLEAKINERTKAVIFVDALGNPTGLHQIKAICERRGIPLIEDAACAIGSMEAGQKCGAIADLTCFSFHPRKLLSTGEGGAITTRRDDWAEWLRVKLAHGAKGTQGLGLDFVDYGYNFRLPELQAIMGRKQLTRMDEVIDRRSAVRASYIEHLMPLGFIPQDVGRDVRYNVQSLVFRVPETVDRDALVHSLKDFEVEATLGTYCLSGTTYFRHRYADVQPTALHLDARTITLPCYEGVPVDIVAERIASSIKTIRA
ncbi:DegT/DnrJ/EryC1/StrS family aminotransferase [Allosphingosinicella vermicomposti]|uniref:DegT/DnrJ/EryC1/StrS family aminotransferase n=1 Tax=Allosphingosinicella vermicomposti TaxID=614671 RepID=UPI000D0F4AD6|nr:DegT/DnrJ/EryC1/StrS family aminotransferase [Allosphingosinicella vermicomposti]